MATAKEPKPMPPPPPPPTPPQPDAEDAHDGDDDEIMDSLIGDVSELSLDPPPASPPAAAVAPAVAPVIAPAIAPAVIGSRANPIVIPESPVPPTDRQFGLPESVLVHRPGAKKQRAEGKNQQNSLMPAKSKSTEADVKEANLLKAVASIRLNLTELKANAATSFGVNITTNTEGLTAAKFPTKRQKCCSSCSPLERRPQLFSGASTK
ncbi:hypothetical protein DFH27DRAFT_616662 [Peziza echinospora]|nr:hypothetical protein DFH27DRAFT_616662 [Peziza echinospora]